MDDENAQNHGLGTAREAGAGAAGVVVRYWAGARAAAGVDHDRMGAGTVADLLEAVHRLHPELAEVTAACTFLVDGRAAQSHTPVPEGAVLEVLPPFAGG